MKKLLIKNIGTLATPIGNTAKSGDKQGEILTLKNCYIVAKDGVITSVGSGTPPSEFEADGWTVVDANGALVTPGLVDSHTHTVFGGWRHEEFSKKLAGVPYLDILKQGGGILSTVEMTRSATDEELYAKSLTVLEEMLSLGTTTCECKSGYGLSLDHEVRQLKTAHRLGEDTQMDIVHTFMGAHAVPKEYADNRRAYIDLLINDMIPSIASEGLAEFCDIFCETGVFSPDESREILTAAKAHGMKVKMHADEINAIGGSQLAAEMCATSAEHLIAIPPEGIKALADSGTVAVLLPLTSLYIDKPYAPARDMINSGIPVAMATDFNPGSCPCPNMQLVLSIGCVKYRLTPEEALTAVTLNAAAAIDRADKIGSIEVGKQADLLIWDAPALSYTVYRFGANLVRSVVKNGEVLVK